MLRVILFLSALSSLLPGAGSGDDNSCSHQPAVSHVFWITIHAREAAIYDSLYQLFVDDLQIPKLFGTETYGSSRYFAILTGNVILEPCGPFEFHESFRQDVMTRFNTLAFRPYESRDSSAAILSELGFHISAQEEDTPLDITVKELTTDFLPVNINKSPGWNERDKIIIDSLKSNQVTNGGGPLGLECLEEVHLGYRTEEYLDLWKKFLSPLENEANLWLLPRRPNLRFLKSEREEIIALVFRVRSLETAAKFLEEKGLLGDHTPGKTEIKLKHLSGIRIYLAE